MNAEIELRSWNRFITRDFVIEPALLGSYHEFPFQNHKIKIHLPNSEMLDRGKRYDDVVSVTTRRAVDNEPVEYTIHKVDLTVILPKKINLPLEVLNRNANAYELFSEKEQKSLNHIASQHENIARQAFDYWVKVVRWKTNISSFGRHEVIDNHSGWMTRLFDISTEKKIWIGPAIGYARSIKRVTKENWSEIQNVLTKGLNPPIFYQLKHDGEQFLESGDLYRATVDFAVACETYLRFVVLNDLPSELNPSMRIFIEEANISQYINKFFPSLLDEKDTKRFKKIKSTLHKLFTARNKVVHMGKMQRLSEETCRKYLEVTNELVSIKPRHVAQ